MEFETKKAKLNSSRGFTLIELLAVVFIMVTLSTISVANFRQGEKRKRAAIAADTVVSVLRTAQNYTLSGKQTNDANPACRTPKYYFVRITYAGVLTLRAVNNCDITDLIETFNLPAGTQVKANGLVMNGSSVATVRLNIYFLAPFGNVRAAVDPVDNSSMAIFTSATITVETVDGSINHTALVDGVSGRIGE